MSKAQEAFELRKKGKYWEALHLSRECYSIDPQDPWNFRALFWSLHSVWKNCDDIEKKQGYARELLEIQIPNGEDAAKDILRSVKHSLDPAYVKVEEAREKSKKGDHKAAVELLESILSTYPSSKVAEEALSWSLWRQLNDVVRSETPSCDDVVKILRRYARCKTIDRPSEIHSRILAAAARAASAKAFPSFCAFLHWWDPASSLQHDDRLQRHSDDGTAFPSTVQLVIRAIGKTIDHEANNNYAEAAIDFIEAHAASYPKDEWVPYYRGLALCRVGRVEEAVKYLLPIARRKRNEFWIWQKLANCYDQGAVEHLACLCRATLCSVREPEFLLQVRKALAQALHSAGHDNEARFQYESVINVKSLHEKDGWKIDADLESIQNENWFEQAVPAPGDALIRGLATQADMLITNDLPWIDALLQAVNIEGKKTKLAIVFTSPSSGLGSVRVRMKDFDLLRTLEPGIPLKIRAVNSGEHTEIVDLERREGEKWDLLGEQYAIVTRVNYEKRVTSLLLDNGETALAHHTSLPESARLSTGDFVLARSTPGSNVRHSQMIRPCDIELPMGPWARYSGTYISKDTSGGHVGSVFLPGYLVGALAIPRDTAAINIAGIAIRQSDGRGDIWWKAITAVVTGNQL